MTKPARMLVRELMIDINKVSLLKKETFLVIYNLFFPINMILIKVKGFVIFT